jgi:hypothetical protein
LTLLDPTAALIAGTLTVPLVILLYMLRLQRRPVRVSTILFWPPARREVQANVPWRMLRPSWLLFLDLLILLLLILATGRPVVTGTGEAGGRVVLLIDTSASMSARDEGPGSPTRLEQAVDRAHRLCDELAGATGGRTVAVVAFASRARLVTEFTASRSRLRDALATIEPTDEPGDLRAALDLLNALTGADEEPTTSAILFSDGAFGRTSGQPAAGTRLRLERIAGPGKPDNVGITALAARRDDRDPAVVHIFAEVINTAPSPRLVPIALSLDAQVVERRPIEIPGSSADAPGRNSVSLDIHAPGAGVLTVAIAREDALEADNSAALVLNAPTRPSAWLVRPEGPSPTPNAPGSWLLADALAELDLRRFEILSPDDYRRRVLAGDLDFTDLVLFDRHNPGVLPRRPTIHFGALPSLPGLEHVDADLAPTPAILWNRTHPILRFVPLDALFVRKPLAVRAVPPAEELARASRTSLLALANDDGVRRVVVAFDLSESNWPIQAHFPVFLAATVEFLTLRAQERAGVAVRTGESTIVQATDAGTIVLDGPTRAEVIARAAGEVRIAAPSRTGVYAVRGPTRTRFLAVNLADSVESTLATADPTITAREAPDASGAGEVHEVWAWFVLGAVVLLLVEWLAYAAGART